MVRPLQHIRDTPREALNWRVFMAIAIIGLTGLSRGGDEGTVGNMTESASWQHEFNVEEGSSMQSNVVSMFQLGNVPGSLLAFFAADRLGRLRTVQLCCLLWILGTAIWISSAGSVGQTLAGRFIAGLGVGGFPVVCPTFLAEVAPRTVRGLAMAIYSASVYIGITIGYGVTASSIKMYSKLDDKVWRVPISINFIYAGLFFIGTFFVRESPRILVKSGQGEKALETLAWYRGMPKDHPYVRDEFEAILEQDEREKQAMSGKNFFTLLKTLFTRSANLYRLFIIGFGIQILGQWSGGGSLTIYASKIFRMVGVSNNTSLYTTLVFGFVKLFASVACAFFLIDVIGRKRSVFIGIGLQTLAALYLTIFVAKVNPDTASSNVIFESASAKRASGGAIFVIFLSGIGWAMGFNTIQYIIGTEIWSLELRALASSLIMAVHFANQYGSSRALQPMLQNMDRWGLFAFWTCIGIVAAIYIFFFIPETSGRNLESMDELFEKRWWQIGMASNRVITGNGYVARQEVPDVEQLPSQSGNNEKAVATDSLDKEKNGKGPENGTKTIDT